MTEPSTTIDPKVFLPQDTGLRGHDLWLRIRKTIEADPASWDQGNWARRDLNAEALTVLSGFGHQVQVPTCGTAMCVAGWACELIGDPPAYTFSSTTYDTLSSANIADTAREALGLNTEQSNELFVGGNTLERLDEVAAWIWGGGERPVSICIDCGTVVCHCVYETDEEEDEL